MEKTLTKHGNSYALIIDRAVMDLLHITPETPLEIATDGEALVITPSNKKKSHKEKLRRAIARIDKDYGRTMKKLAE